MLFSELRAIHNDFDAYQALRAVIFGFRNEKVDIVIQKVDGSTAMSLKPGRTFNLDVLADNVQSIVSITHANGELLQEWLKKATVDFYKTIDDVVNGWLGRLKKIEGAKVIDNRPNDKDSDKHCLWFESESRTQLSVGLPRLDLDPFSYKQCSTGYGHRGIGLAFPKSISFATLIPTETEERLMHKYDLQYTLLRSVRVIKYKLKVHESRELYNYDSDDSDC